MAVRRKMLKDREKLLNYLKHFLETDLLTFSTKQLNRPLFIESAMTVLCITKFY